MAFIGGGNWGRVVRDSSRERLRSAGNNSESGYDQCGSDCGGDRSHASGADPRCRHECRAAGIKASSENKNSAITGAMRYFGLRLDTVPNWEIYDWNQFLGETTFIKNFHDLSRCLDSYMNGAQYEKANLVSNDEFGHPDSHYYLRNAKIQAAHDSFHQLAEDTDDSQKMDARRELVMSLQGIADADMNTIQNPSNFYSFDRLRTVFEIKYRKALRAELDNVGDKISDMGH